MDARARPPYDKNDKGSEQSVQRDCSMVYGIIVTYAVEHSLQEKTRTYSPELTELNHTNMYLFICVLLLYV